MAKPLSMTKEQETALALIASLKITQKGILSKLREQAHNARLEGQTAQAKRLTQQAVTLSRANLVIHRARQKALRVQDLGPINQQLMQIVAQSNKAHSKLQSTVHVLEQAATFVDLLRRTIAVFS